MSQAEQKVSDALAILRAIGFPLSNRTKSGQNRLSKILLAVGNMTPIKSWDQCSFWVDSTSWTARSRDIIRFLNEHYNEKISEGSYDDIRRKNLDYLVAAGVVLSSPNRPNAKTNDGTRSYALNPVAKDVFKLFGRKGWKEAVKRFIEIHGELGKILERPRVQNKIPVTLPSGVRLQLQTGTHNEIQKAVIEEFLPRFAPGAEVLYLGDASQKKLFIDEGKLTALKFFDLSHDRLPDIVAYDAKNNWIFLIEAVHSSNPVSKLRHYEFEQITSSCAAGRVYVTAFMDRKNFAKWVSDISWETEVWLVESPDHMIHFNGDKFIGPHATRPTTKR